MIEIPQFTVQNLRFLLGFEDVVELVTPIYHSILKDSCSGFVVTGNIW